MNGPRLEQLAREWRNFATVRAVWLTWGVACFSGIPLAFHPSYFWVVIWAIIFLVALIAGMVFSRIHGPDAAEIARHLDRTHSELEESSRLWLRPAADLTLLERLQLARLNHAAERLTGNLPSRARLGQPPRNLWPIFLFVFAGIFSIVTAEIGAARLRAHSWSPVVSTTPPRAGLASPAVPAWPKIVGSDLTVTPPAYTGRSPRRVTGLNAEVEETAVLSWSLTLDRPVHDAQLVFGPAATDRSPLRPAADHTLQTTRTVAETTFYSLAATLPDGTTWTPPEIYSLKVVKDQPPNVRVVQPVAARTVVLPAAPTVTVEALGTDDYGLAEAHLVATVAKGSGEAVKFREQAIPFDPDPVQGNPPYTRNRRFTKTLDLAVLGLEPGDELYFYVEARDNRQPTPNRTRSETRFLTLQGPPETRATTGQGVAGINLVPQYFRSERQLIIDTEKLLADRPTLSDKEFRARANDLGADQALLRLRYGQFLGEDQEDGPNADHTEVNLNPLQARAPEAKPGPHAAASIAQRFTQEHAAQDREGGSDESRDANLRPPPTVPLSADQIRQPYVDSHDGQDKATFFDHEAKGTMREALSAMWSAEGALRVAQPQDALAPEHRALDILKDLQQSARAYVQHVGFDPPPLKIDERRLRGDAASVPPRLVAAPDPGAGSDDVRLAVRAALKELPIAGSVRAEILRRVDPILMAAATHQPDDFLPGLQALRRLLADPGADADAAGSSALERALLRLLPPANPLPVRAPEADPTLAAPYFQALQNGEGKL